MRPHQPTPTPHMKGDNRRQRETRPLQSPRRRPHQPTPTPHIKGDNRRQWETTGDKTTSEPKKPTTPTNTKAARSKVALRTPTVNCSGKNAPLPSLKSGTHKQKRNKKTTKPHETEPLSFWTPREIYTGVTFPISLSKRWLETPKPPKLLISKVLRLVDLFDNCNAATPRFLAFG